MSRPIDPCRPPLESPTWRADIAWRIRYLLVLKVAGISVFTCLFIVGYIYLLRHPAYPVTTMPLTAPDHFITFQPEALYAYLTLWFYVGIAPGLQPSLRELLEYTAWVLALCLAGLAAFYFWPTEVPPLAVDRAAYPGFAMLEGVDSTGNACPSMHVGVAMFSAIWVDHVMRQVRAPVFTRLLNAAWFLAIAYSTLATKQHVAWDAVAGALLGIAFAVPSLYLRPARRNAARRAPVARDA